MLRICRSLAGAGYDVTLVGRSLPASIALPEESFNLKRLRCIFKKGPLFYAEYNLRLLVYLLKTPCDAICSVDLDTLPAGCLAAAAKEVKLVYDAHEYFTEVPEVVDRKWVKAIWGLVARWMIPRVDLAYTVSHTIAVALGEKHHRKFEVIRNVPFKREKAALPEEVTARQPYILYQGALNEGRCVEQYIRMVKELDVNLVLAGEGDLSEKLRQLAMTEGVQHKVIFLGWVKPNDLSYWTQGAKIGLNVLENEGLSYYYSLSNKCFDYVQAGVPSISSPFPEYLALNREFEVMLTANAAEDEIRMAVKLLLSDHDEYNKLRKNCLFASEVWNWNEEQQKLTALYGELWK